MDSNLLVSLAEVKGYLRVDYDDDDELIYSLIMASSDYIANATGMTFDMNSSLASMCAKLLVANWYTNRVPVENAKGQEIPYAISYILTQLKYSYATGGSTNG